MAIVKKYQVEVNAIENPVPGIFTVVFTAGDHKFRFKPGQFLHLTIDDYNPSMQWPESRCFSIQSSPEEETLTITFSVVGTYTRRMAGELYPGKKLWLKLPYGDLFSRSHSKSNCVFIAGGTGITPYLSLFTSNAFSEYQNPKLYFGIKTANHNIYTAALGKAIVINTHFDIHLVEERFNGTLAIDTIASENPDTETYFISGPPLMIQGFRQFLEQAGIGHDRIVTDDWE